MAKPQNYEPRQSKSKEEQQSIGKIKKDKLKKMRGKANREADKARGYNPAFVGGGPHGPSAEEENAQKRRKSKSKLNKLRNRTVNDLGED